VHHAAAELYHLSGSVLILLPPQSAPVSESLALLKWITVLRRGSVAPSVHVMDAQADKLFGKLLSRG
jgi:hypothetical protein